MENVCNRRLFSIPSKVEMAEEQEYLFSSVQQTQISYGQDLGTKFRGLFVLMLALGFFFSLLFRLLSLTWCYLWGKGTIDEKS